MYTKENAITYEGTKRLQAWPATRGEYNEYRGWTMPTDEDALEAGYMVEYEQDGHPNHPNHDGYVSWSPATVFERTYKSLGSYGSLDVLSWQDRVRQERDELALRVIKLDEFLAQPTHTVSPYALSLLGVQVEYMRGYLAILVERLRYDEDPEGTPTGIVPGRLSQAFDPATAPDEDTPEWTKEDFERAELKEPIDPDSDKAE